MAMIANILLFAVNAEKMWENLKIYYSHMTVMTAFWLKNARIFRKSRD